MQADSDVTKKECRSGWSHLRFQSAGQLWRHLGSGQAVGSGGTFSSGPGELTGKAMSVDFDQKKAHAIKFFVRVDLTRKVFVTIASRMICTKPCYSY